MMRSKVSIILIISWLGANGVLAQCTDELVDRASDMAGLDAVYLEAFKVKLKAGTIKKPVRVAKFWALLNKDVKYRFTIANDSLLGGRGVLNLLEKNKLLASTYDANLLTDKQQFDFLCEKTGYYRIHMSIDKGKKGCVAAVVSMVLERTTQVYDRRVFYGENAKEILYIGIDNPIEIAASGVSLKDLEVSIINGSISGENGQYNVIVDKPGIAKLEVVSKYRNGKIKEIKTFDYLVIEIPKPQVRLGNSTGGIIDKDELNTNGYIWLSSTADFGYTEFSVQQFDVSKTKEGLDGITNRGRDLSAKQLAFLKNLSSGEVFYLKNIIVKGPGDKLIVLDAVGFIIK